uniref:Immunoglobulin superfamily containing leucine-rich repeat 2 n=1 Tax=Tetraodon nigroviridis TaxID=99883 RepID=H3CSL7_TETNG
LLQIFALWTAVMGFVQSCPEFCSCQDKFTHQFADCTYKDLLAVPVGLPSNVTAVSLSANKIKSLKKSSFVNITQVSSLWLAHNEIVTIEKNTFTPLIHLRNLDVSSNNITFFPWEDLRNLTALQLLKMNNNEMVNLPKDAFSTLIELRSLRINNNKFTTIVQGTFSALTSMSHLQIYNNPFECSCNLEWLRDWISTTKISVPEKNSIVCSTPLHLKGTLVTKLPKLTCKAPTVTVTYQPNIENTELHEGSTVVLSCETTGSPKPQVSWEVKAGNQNHLFPLPSVGEINDAPINDKTTNDRYLVFRNGTLIIPRMSKNEDGNYTCSAVNELGRVDGSVKLVTTASQKQASVLKPDATIAKIRPPVKKPSEPISKSNEINWKKPEEKSKGAPEAVPDKGDSGGQISVVKDPGFGSKCGIRENSEYISNHAFNLSLDDLKQYTFDFGVIALEVSETEAKVQLNPLKLPNSKSTLHSSSSTTPPDMLYLCVKTSDGHSLVQWSKIEEGINAYHFHNLQPGTNYTLCLTYGGKDCQVQVVFTTRKKIPSLLIIVIVSIFLLGLATVPLLGATCCHLLYKYQGKTYRLIMRTQNPDQMEKQMAGDFDMRASFAGSEKTFNPSDLGSVATGSIQGSSSKTNQEEFEMGSEYSDRLPLGAEAVTISEEINGNYKQPAR